jgi:hypothetical protein
MSKSPDEIVAERIVRDLAEKKLIAGDKAAGVLDQLASGALKPDDWRLLADLNEPAPKGEEDGQAEKG